MMRFRMLLLLTLGVCSACAIDPQADWSDAEFERQNEIAKAACFCHPLKQAPMVLSWKRLIISISLPITMPQWHHT